MRRRQPPTTESDSDEDGEEDSDKPKRRRGRRGGRAPRAASARPAARSRRHLITAKRASGSGSTRPCRTIRSTPSPGRVTGPVEVTIEEDRIIIRRAGGDESEDSEDRSLRAEGLGSAGALAPAGPDASLRVLAPDAAAVVGCAAHVTRKRRTGDCATSQASGELGAPCRRSQSTSRCPRQVVLERARPS